MPLSWERRRKARKRDPKSADWNSGAPLRPAKPPRAARGRGAPVRSRLAPGAGFRWSRMRTRGVSLVGAGRARRGCTRGLASRPRNLRRVPSTGAAPSGPARPHVPRAVCVPLRGAQRHGVRGRRDLPGAGAQQHALVVSGTGAQWRDRLRAACLPASPAGECVPPSQACRPNPFASTQDRSRKLSLILRDFYQTRSLRF